MTSFDQGAKIIVLLERIARSVEGIAIALEPQRREAMATREMTYQEVRQERIAALSEWVLRGADMRLAEAMSRSGISPEKAASMTDEEILKLRNVGRTTLARARTLLAS